MSIDPYLSLESSLPYIRLGLFSLFIIYISANDNKFIKIFGVIFLITFLFVCLDAILQAIFGYNIFLIPAYSQITGVFGQEKILGSFISRLLPVICGFLFIIKNRCLKGQGLRIGLVEFLNLICLNTSTSNS